MSDTRSDPDVTSQRRPSPTDGLGELLERQRRLLSVGVLAPATVYLLYGWASDGQAMERALHGLGVLVLLGLFSALLFTKVPAYRLVSLSHHVLTVLMVSAFSVTLLGADDAVSAMRAFDGTYFLTFVLMCVLAFAVFARRTAIRLGSVIVVASSLAVVLWLFTVPTGATLGGRVAVAIAHHVLLVISVVIGYVVTRSSFERRSGAVQAEPTKAIVCRDELTGLPNRLHLTETLDDRFAAAARHPETFSALLLEVDSVERMEQEFGRDFKDRVLQHIAHVMRAVLRAEDAFGRWGGEQFLIIARAGEQGARILAERIRAAVERHAFPGGVYVTVSIGVARGSPELARDALLAIAEGRRYAAREAGGNCAVASDDAT